MKKLLFTGFLMSLLFWGCTDKGPDYAQLIMGTWVNTQVDSLPVLTDASFVMEFRADSVQMYAVGSMLDTANKAWAEYDYFRYSVAGNNIFIDGTNGSNGVFHMELEITSVNDSTLTYSVKKMTIDSIEYPDPKVYSCQKVTSDNRDQLIGIWFGKCTTPGAADTGDHYWEFFANSRYTYYYQDKEGKWLVDSNDESRYFLYGTLLTSNYYDVDIADGTLKTFDCWNMRISGDTLTLTSLRENGVVLTYRMEKATNTPKVD